MKVDTKAKTITGKDSFGTEFTFHLQEATRFRLQSLPDETVTLAAYRVAGIPLPVRVHDKVLVKWHPDPAGTRRLAIEIEAPR